MSDLMSTVSMQRMTDSAAHGDCWPIWDNQAARFYVNGLNQSDYGERVGNALLALLGRVDSLLDIGAGSGVLGRILVNRQGHWTAVEPNGYLADLLTAQRGIRVLRNTWQNLRVSHALAHEVVLAANTSGPLEDPQRFLRTLRPLAKGALCWVVPAQRGPRRRCLSGFLPAELHGEDERPGVEWVLERLPSAWQPQELHFAEWTFRYCFPDFPAAEQHFRHCVAIGDDEHPLARRLRLHLEENLAKTAHGLLASAPKRSALLLWRNQ